MYLSHIVRHIFAAGFALLKKLLNNVQIFASSAQLVLIVKLVIACIVDVDGFWRFKMKTMIILEKQDTGS